MPYGEDRACELQIEIGGRGPWASQHIYGIGSAQALVLALGVIPGFVASLERETGGTVHWAGGPGSGFPRHLPLI